MSSHVIGWRAARARAAQVQQSRAGSLHTGYMQQAAVIRPKENPDVPVFINLITLRFLFKTDD